MPPTPSSSRPYRSHKVPACETCRKRKIHCNVDVPDQPCRFCRERQLACKMTPKPASADSRPTGKRRKVLQTRGQSAVTDDSLSKSVVAEISEDESSLMLNPPMAEDVEILEHYLSSQGAAGAAVAKPYSVVSNTPGKPIVYLRLPRRRQGLQLGESPGLKQREIMEQVLASVRDDVVDLYFAKLHPCFPIIDEKTFRELWQKDRARISSTLMCDIYAAALHFWHTSERLRHHKQPDLAFMWNQAVSALHEDFLGSTMSTIYASLLDLIGRPVLSIAGNVVTLGRTVSLAYSLGLHRDPTSWHTTEHEKDVRVRLWWGVLVHDHWFAIPSLLGTGSTALTIDTRSSLAHGTPPLIQPQNYDVPLPVIASSGNHPDPVSRAQSIFVELCRLSQVLGQLLPLVYALNNDRTTTERVLHQTESKLDECEPQILQHQQKFTLGLVNGSSNLHFCYLSVKLLLRRIAFKGAASTALSEAAERQAHELGMLREAAFALIDFVASLTRTHFEEFWLPYTAHLLVTVTTITLRCLLESVDPDTRHTCAARLVLLKNHLILAKHEHGWDLANFCLDRCSEPIDRVSTAAGNSDHVTEATPAQLRADAFGSERHQPTLEELDLELLFHVDSLDYPFDTLWDMPP